MTAAAHKKLWIAAAVLVGLLLVSVNAWAIVTAMF